MLRHRHPTPCLIVLTSSPYFHPVPSPSSCWDSQFSRWGGGLPLGTLAQLRFPAPVAAPDSFVKASIYLLFLGVKHIDSFSHQSWGSMQNKLFSQLLPYTWPLQELLNVNDRSLWALCCGQSEAGHFVTRWHPGSTSLSLSVWLAPQCSVIQERSGIHLSAWLICGKEEFLINRLTW